MLTFEEWWASLLQDGGAIRQPPYVGGFDEAVAKSWAEAAWQAATIAEMNRLIDLAEQNVRLGEANKNPVLAYELGKREGIAAERNACAQLAGVRWLMRSPPQSEPEVPMYCEPSREKIVTHSQFGEGWFEKQGHMVYTRPFVLISKTSDGNYVVENPDWIVWKERKDALKS